MSKHLVIESVRVEQMYDLRMQGIHAEGLVPGLNVIYGENAQGKTTFALAMQGIIWPDRVDDKRPRVEASFRLGEDEWKIRYETGYRSLLKNGSRSTLDVRTAPGDHLPYYLPLKDLLTDKGESFGEKIRREADGRYNIREAADSLNYEISPNRGIPGVARAFKAAKEDIKSIQRTQSDLKRRERTLTRLKKELDESREADDRAKYLELVLRCKVAEKKLEEARIHFEAFDIRLAQVQSDDADRLKKDHKDIEEARTSLDEAQDALEKLQAELAENRISKSDQEAVSPEDVDACLGDLQSYARQLEQSEQDIAALKTKVQEAHAFLKEVDNDAPKLSRDALRRAKDLFYENLQLVALRNKNEQLRRMYSRREQTNAETLQMQLQQDVGELQKWLNKQVASKQTEKAGIGALAGILILMLLGAGFLILWNNPVAALIAGVSVGVLAIIWFLLRAMRNVEFPVVSAESVPEEQTREAVSRKINELMNRRATVIVDALKADLWRKESADAEIQQRETALQQKWNDLNRETGIGPIDDLPLFSDNLFRWQEAGRELAGKEAGQSLIETSYAREKKRLVAMLNPFGLDLGDDVGSARQAVGAYKAAWNQHVALVRDISDQEGIIRDAQKKIVTAESDFAQICKRIGLDKSEALPIIDKLVERLDDYRRSRQEYEAAKTQAETHLRELQDHKLFEESALSMPESELQRLIDAVREKADSRDDVVAKISEIDTLLKEARTANDLTKALANRDRLGDELAEHYRTVCASAFGKMLADHVERKTRSELLPKVFRRAAELFALFTKSNYQLDFDYAKDLFRARSTNRDNQVFELDELSAGTRVQLQLAVRIAFVEKQESDVRLPLLLDETLANSDDLRAEAIIGAILELCKQGRQVFYFTAQKDEVAKMRRVADHNPDVKIRFVSLPAGESTFDAADALPSIPQERVDPPQEGQTHHEYGIQLNVPRWTLWDEVSSLHLWYLEPDLARLYGAVNSGFDYWGALQTLQESGSLALAGYDETSILPLAVKAKALELWRENWLIGRGKKVDRRTLEESRAISATFMDRIYELCLRADGDAAALIYELTVNRPKRFSANSRDALEEYLREEGYIDDAEPLKQEEIRTRMFARIHEDLDQAGLQVADIDGFIRNIQTGPFIDHGNH